MIPLSVPNLSGNEWKYIKECLDTNWVSSVGSFVNRFEEMTAEFTGAKYAVATSNGSAALHISLMLAGVKQNDYVLVPNLTFVASVNTITYTGASPLLVDVDPLKWQIDLNLLEKFLYEETALKEGECIYRKNGRVIRAIMPVHVLGNMCDMDRLMKLASSFNIVVVEDATEALGSSYKSKHSGTFGLLGAFSYNGNKIMTTGGGGMIITNDAELARKAKHITTQAKADPMEYYHDEIGYNYRLVNLLAAMGVAQMEQLPGFLERKRLIRELYERELKELPGFQLQEVSEDVKPNNWLFTLKVPEKVRLLKYLTDNGIQARPFWVPMNRLPMFGSEVYITNGDVSGSVYDSCVSLPCSTSITDDEVSEVCIRIKKVSES